MNYTNIIFLSSLHSIRVTNIFNVENFLSEAEYEKDISRKRELKKTGVDNAVMCVEKKVNLTEKDY